jgi:phosphoribosylformylglycinamidine synthase
VRACVVTGYGINADRELALAFGMAGARSELVHVTDLIAEPELLARHAILAFPGGFSFGDHLGSGKVFAHLCRRTLRPALERFVSGGGLVIGICNGFQVLVKMGLLPGLSARWEQEVSLVHNESGVFEDRWVRVAFEPDSPCLWTRGLGVMDLPVRHGEGRFVARSPEVLHGLHERRLVAARYVREAAGGSGKLEVAAGPGSWPANPNGSADGIAGICDATGRLFGLMPHPEAFVRGEQHPTWARRPAFGDGLAIFANGVAAARTR